MPDGVSMGAGVVLADKTSPLDVYGVLGVKGDELSDRAAIGAIWRCARRFKHLVGGTCVENERTDGHGPDRSRPRGRCHARLFQHLTGKGKTVGRIWRRRRRDRRRRRRAGLLSLSRQTRDQNAAVLLVAALHLFQLVAALERRLGGNLRQRRHRNRKILLQPLDRAHQRRGATIQPTRQPVMQKYFENELITSACGDNSAAVTAGKA